MALTLQQSINLKAGKDLTTVVTVNQKISEAVSTVAASVLNGTLTIADTTITGHGVTAQQLTNWAQKAAACINNPALAQLIISDAAFSGNLATIADADIITAVKKAVWPIALISQTIF
jgi:hypothetical protein